MYIYHIIANNLPKIENIYQETGVLPELCDMQKAAKKGRYDIIKWFLKITVNTPDFNHSVNTIFISGCIGGNYSLVKYMYDTFNQVNVNYNYCQAFRECVYFKPLIAEWLVTKSKYTELIFHIHNKKASIISTKQIDFFGHYPRFCYLQYHIYIVREIIIVNGDMIYKRYDDYLQNVHKYITDIMLVRAKSARSVLV
jgi:hypothetical protein